MSESSRMPLFDLRKLNASLTVPKPMENSTKVLVLGAKDDFIVVRTKNVPSFVLSNQESFSILVPVLNQNGLLISRTMKD